MKIIITLTMILAIVFMVSGKVYLHSIASTDRVTALVNKAAKSKGATDMLRQKLTAEATVSEVLKLDDEVESILKKDIIKNIGASNGSAS